jgi:hypothetical protein
MPARERDRLVNGSDPYGDACTEKMRRLVKLRGVGAEFAPVLTPEVFYRSFQKPPASRQLRRLDAGNV